jgi:hypothetical protein
MCISTKKKKQKKKKRRGKQQRCWFTNTEPANFPYDQGIAYWFTEGAVLILRRDYLRRDLPPLVVETPQETLLQFQLRP